LPYALLGDTFYHTAATDRTHFSLGDSIFNHTMQIFVSQILDNQIFLMYGSSMNTKQLILLTRFSIGSLNLTDRAKRSILAKEVKRLRKTQRELWAWHGQPNTYRIFS